MHLTYSHPRIPYSDNRPCPPLNSLVDTKTGDSKLGKKIQRINLDEQRKRLAAYRIILSEQNSDCIDEQLAASLLSYMGVTECDEIIYKIAVAKLKCGEPFTKDEASRLGLTPEQANDSTIKGLIYNTPVEVTVEPATHLEKNKQLEQD